MGDANDTSDYLIEKRMSTHVVLCSEKNKKEMVQASDRKLRMLMEILRSIKRPKEESEVVKDYILA